MQLVSAWVPIVHSALQCAANTKIHHIIAFIKTLGRGYFQLSRHTAAKMWNFWNSLKLFY